MTVIPNIQNVALYEPERVAKAIEDGKWVTLVATSWEAKTLQEQADAVKSSAVVTCLPSSGPVGDQAIEQLAGAKILVAQLGAMPKWSDKRTAEITAKVEAVAKEVRRVRVPALEWSAVGEAWRAAGERAAAQPSREEAPPEDPRTAPPAARASLTYQLASSITPSRPVWLWDRWIAAGNVHLLAGRQGGGKTTWASYIVAQLVNGQALPGDTPRPPVRVAFLSLEEPKDRVVARLTAAGADLDRILVLGDVEDHDDEGNLYRRPWRLPGDVSILGTRIEEAALNLVVVDGIGYALNGDSNSYGAVGSALSALGAEAERTGAAILGLTHTPKGGSEAVTAAIGSTAWTALARISWVLGTDQEDKAVKRINVGKSNYKHPLSGWRFEIHDDPATEAGYVAALEPSEVTGDEIVAASASPEERSELADATAFLSDLLEGGELAASAVFKQADAHGISRRTLKRAKASLNVRSRKLGVAEGWVWGLPSEGGQGGWPPSETASDGSLGILGADQDFRAPEPPNEPEGGPFPLVGPLGPLGTLESDLEAVLSEDELARLGARILDGAPEGSAAHAALDSGGYFEVEQITRRQGAEIEAILERHEEGS